MKEQDLMIGDFIHHKTTGETLQVTEILSWGVKVKEYDDAVADSIDIQPIPLTREILEKNGFRFDGSGQMSMMLMTPHGDSGTRWIINVGLKHKTIEVFSAPPLEKYPGCRKLNKVYLEVCGCYVHELQHAIRMCGIEKEIEL